MTKEEDHFVALSIFLSVTVICITLGFTLPRLLMANFEVEGSCNSGKIGIDFSERFVFNETNPKKPLMSHQPQKLDIKGIDGITCNYKVKGNLPIIALIDKWQEMQK